MWSPSSTKVARRENWNHSSSTAVTLKSNQPFWDIECVFDRFSSTDEKGRLHFHVLRPWHTSQLLWPTFVNHIQHRRTIKIYSKFLKPRSLGISRDNMIGKTALNWLDSIWNCWQCWPEWTNTFILVHHAVDIWEQYIKIQYFWETMSANMSPTNLTSVYWLTFMGFQVPNILHSKRDASL